MPRPISHQVLETWAESGLLSEEELEVISGAIGEPEGTWEGTLDAVVPEARRPELRRLAELAAESALLDPAPERDGRYRVVRLLGEGGMGRVLVADDGELGRRIALKECKAPTPGAVHRFLREARVMAQLEHPGIVPVYELGFRSSGQPYYTMRRVRGLTLREALSDRTTLDDRLALLGHIVAIGQAVGFAHAKGVVHRDLKPDNVMIGNFGETVVLDWGLARMDAAPPEASESVALNPGDLQHTQAGAVVGTIAYMSPEQARGQPISPRSDVYSLGVIFWELLSGNVPYAGLSGNMALAQARKGALGPVPAGTPPELAAVAARALHPDPLARYADAAGLAADIEAWRNGQRVGAYSYTARALAVRWAKRHRAPLVVAAAAAGVLLLGGAWAAVEIVGQRDEARDQRDIAEVARAEATARGHDLQIAGLRAAGELDLERGFPAEAAALLSAALLLDSAPDRERLVELDRVSAGAAALHLPPAAGAVTQLAASPDGRDLFVASAVSANAFNMIRGTLTPLARTTGKACRSVVVLADGTSVGVFDNESQTPEVIVHNLESGTVLRDWPLPVEPSDWSFALSADGRVAVYQYHSKFRMIDTKTGAPGTEMEARGGPDWREYYPVLTDGGDSLLTIVEDDEGGLRLLRKRSVKSGKIVGERNLTGNIGALAAGASSVAVLSGDRDAPTATLLLTGDGVPDAYMPGARPSHDVLLSTNGRTVIESEASGVSAWRDGVRLPAVSGGVPTALSERGRWLGVGGPANAVVLTDLDGARPRRTLLGFRAPLSLITVAGTRVFGGAEDGTVIAWPLELQDESKATIPRPKGVFSLVTDASGTLGFVDQWAMEVGFWAAGANAPAVSNLGARGFACTAAIEPGGAAMLVQASPLCIHGAMWKSVDGTEITSMFRVGVGRPPELLLNLPMSLVIGYSAIAPDAKRVAVTLTDGCVGVWSLTGAQPTPGLHLCSGEKIGPVRWSGDGKWILTLSRSAGELAVWSAATGSLTSQHRVPEGIPWLSASPDGGSVSYASYHGSVTVLTVPGLAPVWSGEANGDPSADIAWDARGARLAIPQTTGGILVTTPGVPDSTMLARPFGNPVVASAWSPDGSRLAAGDAAGGLVILDSQTLTPLITLNLLKDPVTALAWAPDGTTLHVATGAGPLYAIPSRPLRAATEIVAQIAADTNLRACANHPGEVIRAIPWSQYPTMDAVNCSKDQRTNAPARQR